MMYCANTDALERKDAADMQADRNREMYADMAREQLVERQFLHPETIADLLFDDVPYALGDDGQEKFLAALTDRDAATLGKLILEAAYDCSERLVKEHEVSELAREIGDG